ncbi:replication-associated protein [Pacific flying fox faeces associated circular DNA virus-9]|nr:replication-associated protein [Pacific flying fox faeces associated circular DNA virus-9]
MFAKFWLITAHFDEEEFLDLVTTELGELSPVIRFVWWQLEAGEQRGSLHVQAYLGLHRSQRLSYVVGLFDGASRPVHAEPRRGTHEQAIQYCTKEDTRRAGPWFLGQPEETGPGQSNALLDIRDGLDRGVTLVELARQDNLFGALIRNIRGLQWYAAQTGVDRNWETTVIILSGAPGVGKSRAAEAAARIVGVPYYLTRPQAANSLPWWDGYTPGAPVVIDDFYGWIKLDTMLRLMDRYPMQVETKGGMLKFTSRLMIVTSNYEWRNWYRTAGNAHFPRNFERRINRDIYMTAEDDYLDIVRSILQVYNDMHNTFHWICDYV